MLSHGFLKNRVSKEVINRINNLCFKYIKNESSDNTYFNLNKENIFYELRKIDTCFLEDVNYLLKTKTPKLEAIELHIQKSGCRKIPPHQDNFYHCIEPNKGLKILLPLQKLNSKNGGLTFLDCDLNFPVQQHDASSVKNFSSYISSTIFNKIKLPKTSYNYMPGDVSFHFLNSLHYSLGNSSKKDTLFLVYRYQNPNATINLLAQSRYNKCVEEHHKLIKN